MTKKRFTPVDPLNVAPVAGTVQQKKNVSQESSQGTESSVVGGPVRRPFHVHSGECLPHPQGYLLFAEAKIPRSEGDVLGHAGKEELVFWV
ncbi:MAG: hypothetical protein HGA95_03625, partial [Caldiserica bacterium]|nr:hypothetical protein [Caldisericota bacterium]